MEKEKMEIRKYHLFFDEAGDTAFYGKGKTPIIGSDGVSKSFIMGMLRIKEPLSEVRKKVIDLQNKIANDQYFESVPSIQKKKAAHGYYLHAKDDVPEVRKMAFELINSIDCTFNAIVGRKVYSIYEEKHNGREEEFYADLLFHLIRESMEKNEELVLNIAKRGKCTTQNNLQKGLNKAMKELAINNSEEQNDSKIVFNVQHPTKEPLLNLSDYFCWAMQRFWEKGEIRYWDFISHKVKRVGWRKG